MWGPTGGITQRRTRVPGMLAAGDKASAGRTPLTPLCSATNPTPGVGEHRRHRARGPARLPGREGRCYPQVRHRCCLVAAGAAVACMQQQPAAAHCRCCMRRRRRKPHAAAAAWCRVPLPPLLPLLLPTLLLNAWPLCRYMADEARSLKAYGELPENSECCAAPALRPCTLQRATGSGGSVAGGCRSGHSCGGHAGGSALALLCASCFGFTKPEPSSAHPLRPPPPPTCASACSPRERHGCAQRRGGRRERRLHRLRRHQR